MIKNYKNKFHLKYVAKRIIPNYNRIQWNFIKYSYMVDILYEEYIHKKTVLSLECWRSLGILQLFLMYVIESDLI